MGRHARLVVPGVALHIFHRGNNRQDCFQHRSDRLVSLAILFDLCGKRPCALHADCLMTNHVHLLVTPQDMTVCALLMRDIAGSYVSYFNRRYERTGTLWEGRFGSCLVDSARYVLGCYARAQTSASISAMSLRLTQNLLLLASSMARAVLHTALFLRPEMIRP